MIKNPPKYLHINAVRDISKFAPYGKKFFDLVVLLPKEYNAANLGQLMHSLYDLKVRYNPSKSILVLWTGGISHGSKVTPVESFWNYFQTLGQTEELYMAELNFHGTKTNASSRLKTFFTLLKKINFDHCMVYTPTKFSEPSAEKYHYLIENCKQNKSDLNLAAYVIPFYKGFMVNYWITPLSYLFGRRIRNAASPDFVFTKSCLSFWNKQSWPETTGVQSCFLFLTLSAFTSGLKITEFFMGERFIDPLPRHDEREELLKTGLWLIERYKTFIRNCQMLITCQNKHMSQIQFTIYSPSDLEDILVSYERHKSHLGHRFPLLLKKNLGPKSVDTIMQYFRKCSTPENIKEPDDLWNLILLSLIEAYLSSKSSKRREEILDIFLHIFSVKPRLWSDEIRMLIKTTREKALDDGKHGFPWLNGESGQYWHIHDSFEKKLHEDLARLYSLKTEIF